MSISKTSLRASMLLLAVALGLPGAARAQAPGVVGWTSSFYLGVEAGTASLDISSQSTTMEGIVFTGIEASADDAGVKAFVGYHIIENLAVEWSASWLGKAHATFEYFDPPGERGTGETTVSMYSSGLSMTLGLPVRNWLFYARGGIDFWRANYDTRFDLPSGEHQQRWLYRSGNSLYYGGGLLWNFWPNWSLRVEAEQIEVDIADVTMIALGVEARLW